MGGGIRIVCIVIVWLLLFALAAPVAWWSIADVSPPFHETRTPYITDERGEHRTMWRAGETMYVHREYCMLRAMEGTVYPSIINTQVHPLEPRPARSTTAPGCGSLDIPITIPRALTPGPYFYHAEISSYINPIKGNIRYSARDVPFTVVSNPVLDEVTGRYMLLERRVKELERRAGVIRP